MTFQKAVRGWLGLPAEEVPKAHEEGHGLEAKLETFCEAHLDQDLTEDEIVLFREMVVALANQIGQVLTRADRLETLGIAALNTRLETITSTYRLARNAWKIVKIKGELL